MKRLDVKWKRTKRIPHHEQLLHESACLHRRCRDSRDTVDNQNVQNQNFQKVKAEPSVPCFIRVQPTSHKVNFCRTKPVTLEGKGGVMSYLNLNSPQDEWPARPATSRGVTSCERGGSFHRCLRPALSLSVLPPVASVGPSPVALRTALHCSGSSSHL